MNKDSELISEAYKDMFRTDGSLSPEIEDLVLTIRDEVLNMGGKEEDFEEHVNRYLEKLREHILRNYDR